MAFVGDPYEAGRVQIRRKGLNARFLIRNKAQSPRILDQVAQFISHWKTVSDGSAIDRSDIASTQKIVGKKYWTEACIELKYTECQGAIYQIICGIIKDYMKTIEIYLCNQWEYVCNILIYLPTQTWVVDEVIIIITAV